MNLDPIPEWKTRLLQLPRFSGGLGKISLAGTIADSEGAGKPRMRVFGQWALVYIVAGGGVYKDQRGTTQEIKAGSWILVFPELAHSYRPTPGSKWDEIYVCFQGPVFEVWRNTGILDPERPTGHWLDPEQGVRVFEGFFQRIQSPGCSGLKAICLWQDLLSDIIKEKTLPGTKRAGWLGTALELLEQTGSECGPGLLRRTAAACGLNYESFRKKFESAVGMPPGRYVSEHRIEQARRLLALQSLTNAEIASTLGFYDEFHFSKTFSRWAGISPKQFRKQLREN